MTRRRVRRPAAALLGAAVVAAGITVASTGADAAPVTSAATGRTETPLTSSSPTRDVLVSQVTLDAPLPAAAGAHPAGCDKLSYLRFRHRNGPAASSGAAKILLAQPGALAGASSLDVIARNTLVNAAAKGQYLEFWALDRRANCLEDNAGNVAAVAENDPTIALNYYTKGATVDGKKFAGYVPNSQLKWLEKMGIQQSVLDEYTVLTREVPDPAVRAAKVWCGGHSLGGVVTAFFAMSDFDGNPATKTDAGYNQCAGYFALDTQIATTINGDLPQPASMPGLVKAGRGAVEAGYAAGTLPRSLNVPVVNPETINLLALAGVYASVHPDGLSTLPKEFDKNSNVSLAMRTLISKDAVQFLTGSPKVSDYRITNEAALGTLLDDNSMPLAVLQESVGFFGGTGKIADKDFPQPNDLLAIKDLQGLLAPLTGTDKKAIPDDAGPAGKRGTGPLYTWKNYDEVTDIPKAKDGRPFTAPAKEVTDIKDLARVLSEYPLDFTEHYFPLKMMTDTALWASGDRSIVPTAVHTEALTARPSITLLGGDGLVLPMLTGKPLPPNTLVLPGYQHLDVLTAAPVQNDGKPEKGAAALAAFVLGH